MYKGWECTSCSLYLPPPHTIHPPLTDLVLEESVNYFRIQKTMLTSGMFKAHTWLTVMVTGQL